MALPRQMRAVVIDATHGSFTPKDVPIPQAGEGQVLVRLHACGVCRGDDELQQNLLPQASDRVRIDCELAHCLVCGLDSLAAASASDEASKARHMAAWIRFQCRSADAKGEQQPTLRQLRLRRAQLQLAIDSGLDTAHTCCAWDSGVEQAALEEYEQTCEADHLEWVAQAYGLPSVEEMQHQLRGAKKRDKGEAEKG